MFEEQNFWRVCIRGFTEVKKKKIPLGLKKVNANIAQIQNDTKNAADKRRKKKHPQQLKADSSEEKEMRTFYQLYVIQNEDFLINKHCFNLGH